MMRIPKVFRRSRAPLRARQPVAQGDQFRLKEIEAAVRAGLGIPKAPQGAEDDQSGLPGPVQEVVAAVRTELRLHEDAAR